MALEDSVPSEHFKLKDKASFETLFNLHYATLCRYARKYTGDMDKARDLAQDVFVSFYINKKASEIQTSAKAYLYKSVHNACLNYIHQTKMQAGHHENIKLQTPESDDRDVMISMEIEARIWSMVHDLPEQCGRIFRMNRFEGRKNSEIAEALNISVRTVETQISKALKILRENLGDLLTTLFLIISAS